MSKKKRKANKIKKQACSKGTDKTFDEIKKCVSKIDKEDTIKFESVQCR